MAPDENEFDTLALEGGDSTNIAEILKIRINFTMSVSLQHPHFASQKASH